MIISKKDVIYTAELAHLNVSEEQADKLTSEMESIINFANMLSEIEFDDVVSDNSNRLQNVFRDDVVTNQDRREEMLENAPKTKEGCYCVPNVI
jgi:aspartyl-tRNA(Asn)/glutamyl-tRNA(Gln) amidotransferase subunit C